MAQKVIDNVRTMGVAIRPCTVPAAGKPGFELGEDEMEVGIGIHGEPGTHKEALRPRTRSSIIFWTRFWPISITPAMRSPSWSTPPAQRR